MRKKTYLFIFFVFVFFCLMMPTYATSYITTRDAVFIRKGPGTNYQSYALSQVGATYYLMNNNIVADEPKNGSCNDGWYEINYNGNKAYVCSSYVQIYDDTEEDDKEPTTACETEMKNAGFPSSYWAGLCSIKAKHPNWTMKAIITNLDWKTAVEKESSCGKSLIQTNTKDFLDSSCSVREGGFKAASQKAVAFYMDPRNFLTEKYIFQFEYLKYDQDLDSEYTEAVRKLIGNAEFYKYHMNAGTDFAALTSQAGKEENISPISLASRMYQEMGASTSLYNLYSGTYVKSKPSPTDNADEWDPNEWLGYYNFYNIGVNTTCNIKYGVVYCGLGYAKSSGWNTVLNAIKGGASFLSRGYLNVGQYTPYLQKYNVVPTNIQSLYTHQYMTNIMAPSSEATSTYNSYNRMGLIDRAFAFYIPVYKNMSASIDNSSNGGTNDPSESSPISTEIGTIVTSAGYKTSGENISGIKAGSAASDVKKQIESIAGSGNVVIMNANAKEVTTEKIGTGFKVKITNSSGSKTYTVIVKGDTSGDGIVNALDLLQVQKQILGTYTLKDVYKLAGDPSGDGKINALDLLQVQKQILGTYTINQ